MTRIIPIEPSIPGEPKVPDNTWRAKSTRQYPESQKRQTIPGEPKSPDNTQEPKVPDNTVDSQLLLDNNYFFTIPGEPKVPEMLGGQKHQTIP